MNSVALPPWYYFQSICPGDSNVTLNLADTNAQYLVRVNGVAVPCFAVINIQAGATTLHVNHQFSQGDVVTVDQTHFKPCGGASPVWRLGPITVNIGLCDLDIWALSSNGIYELAPHAPAKQGGQLWSINTSSGNYTHHGRLPFPTDQLIHGPDNPNWTWTSVAILNRRLYFVQSVETGNWLNVFSLCADGIKHIARQGEMVISNLDFVGTIPFAGNIHGLCAGNDGNLYFTAMVTVNCHLFPPGYEDYTTGGMPTGRDNGLFRFRLRDNTFVTECVGVFQHEHHWPSVDPLNPGREVFYEDLSFHPRTGNLIGVGGVRNGIDLPFTLYEIQNHQWRDLRFVTKQRFAFQKWQPTNVKFGELDKGFFGLTFDPRNGDLFLAAGGSGIRVLHQGSTMVEDMFKPSDANTPVLGDLAMEPGPYLSWNSVAGPIIG